VNQALTRHAFLLLRTYDTSESLREDLRSQEVALTKERHVMLEHQRKLHSSSSLLDTALYACILAQAGKALCIKRQASALRRWSLFLAHLSAEDLRYWDRSLSLARLLAGVAAKALRWPLRYASLPPFPPACLLKTNTTTTTAATATTSAAGCGLIQ
jgi:hypothetical protein